MRTRLYSLDELDDIPGTKVFNAMRSRQAYHLHKFCMSLMDPANREAFRRDESAYLDRFRMSPEPVSYTHLPAKDPMREAERPGAAGAVLHRCRNPAPLSCPYPIWETTIECFAASLFRFRIRGRCRRGTT